jgi:hypothetical protein
VKPFASLSLDLDNEWSYLKTRGDDSWKSFPSYLDVVVPRFLEMMRRLDLRVTVFIVGQDAALEKNATALRSIADAGHEIGCHSFNHEPWLHLYSRDQLRDELTRATDAIAAVTGIRPAGFRGPGFSLSKTTLETLVELGYRYDCTTFPTFIGPLARQYYFWTARLDKNDRARRDALFGTFEDGRRPLHAYRWNLGADTLIEIPVSTFPVVKVPMHFSYLLFLAQKLPGLALPYFAAGLATSRALGIAPSLLLHPLDFLDADDVPPALRFFPAMSLPRERKLATLEHLVKHYARSFEVIPVGEHAARVEADANTPVRLPTFSLAASP